MWVVMLVQGHSGRHVPFGEWEDVLEAHRWAQTGLSLHTGDSWYVTQVRPIAGAAKERHDEFTAKFAHLDDED